MADEPSASDGPAEGANDERLRAAERDLRAADDIRGFAPGEPSGGSERGKHQHDEREHAHMPRHAREQRVDAVWPA